MTFFLSPLPFLSCFPLFARTHTQVSLICVSCHSAFFSPLTCCYRRNFGCECIFMSMESIPHPQKGVLAFFFSGFPTGYLYFNHFSFSPGIVFTRSSCYVHLCCYFATQSVSIKAFTVYYSVQRMTAIINEDLKRRVLYAS